MMKAMAGRFLDDLRALLADYGLFRHDASRRLARLRTTELVTFVKSYRSLYAGPGGGVRLGQQADGVVLWPEHISTIRPAGLDEWEPRLRAWSLWVDCVYVPDPVLSISPPSRQPYDLNFGDERPLATRLGEALGSLFDLWPFIETGYVQLTGVPLLREPPEVVPITVDPATDRFDPELLNIALSHLRISPAQGAGAGFIIHPERSRNATEDIEPVDGLALQFDDDADNLGEVYFWGEPVRIDEETRTALIHIPRSGGPIPSDAFEPWLRQSKVKVLRHRFSELFDEVGWSTELHADFFTLSPTNRDLLARVGHAAAPENVTKVADLRLPALMEAPIADLAGIRLDVDGLRRFRLQLRDLLNGIRSPSDSPDYARDLEEARRVLLEEMLPEAQAQIRSARTTAIEGAAFALIATVVGTFSGVALATAGAYIAAIPAFASVIRAFTSGEQRPLLVYQQAQKAARRRARRPRPRPPNR
jgi:hypothetical protein